MALTAARIAALALLVSSLALGVGLGTGAPSLARLARYETKAIEGMPIVGNKAAFRLFDMPDSVAVYGTQYFLPSRGTIIMLHGLGAHDGIAMQAGDSLRHATGMNVLFLDLRGNGRSGGARGRIGHDTQYADDLAGVVRELKRANPLTYIQIQSRTITSQMCKLILMNCVSNAVNIK